MSKGLGITLWTLSSLAVLWTLLALAGWFTMGGMMGRGSGAAGMEGGMHGMMGGRMMLGMMVHTTITWIVMLGLVGVFVYLFATSRAGSRSSGSP